jgi:hypothetical protein
MQDWSAVTANQNDVLCIKRLYWDLIHHKADWCTTARQCCGWTDWPATSILFNSRLDSLVGLADGQPWNCVFPWTTLNKGEPLNAKMTKRPAIGSPWAITRHSRGHWIAKLLLGHPDINPTTKIYGGTWVLSRAASSKRQVKSLDADKYGLQA